MAYPIRISPWSDGKPPQTVRQASGGPSPAAPADGEDEITRLPVRPLLLTAEQAASALSICRCRSDRAGAFPLPRWTSTSSGCGGRRISTRKCGGRPTVPRHEDWLIQPAAKLDRGRRKRRALRGTVWNGGATQ